jgi:hypothetical protein
MDAVRDSAQQTMNDHRDAQVQCGFTSAIGITVRHIQEKLDGFRKQMKGPGPSQCRLSRGCRGTCPLLCRGSGPNLECAWASWSHASVPGCRL